jgi:hypothetical protein
MTARYLATITLFILGLLSHQSHAQTTAAKATGPVRMESATISGRGTELLVRFDRPISHERSWLTLVRDGKVVLVMHPRLGAAPNVLFARIQTPLPGNYIVRWTVCPEGSNDRYDGEFVFTIGNDVAASTAQPAR